MDLSCSFNLVIPLCEAFESLTAAGLGSLWEEPIIPWSGDSAFSFLLRLAIVTRQITELPWEVQIMSLVSPLTWDLINFIMQCRFWLKIISREKTVRGTHSRFLRMWDSASCLRWLSSQRLVPCHPPKPPLPLEVSSPSLLIYVCSLIQHTGYTNSLLSPPHTSYLFVTKDNMETFKQMLMCWCRIYKAMLL